MRVYANKKTKNFPFLLQTEFEQIWKWMYHSISSISSQIRGIPIAGELLWVVNGHGKNLEALEKGYTSAEFFHQEILHYTLKLWNSFHSHFPVATKNIATHINNYEEIYRNFLQTIYTQEKEDVYLLCPITSHHLGSLSHFLALQQQMINCCKNLSKYLSSAEVLSKNIANLQVLGNCVEVFQKKLQESQKQLRVPAYKNVFLPQEHFFLCIKGIENILENSWKFFSFLPNNSLWEHLESFLQPIQKEYTWLFSETSPQKNYTIPYFPLFGQSFPSSILWYSCSNNTATPIRLEYQVVPWDDSEKHILHLLIQRYTEYPNDSVYSKLLILLEKITDDNKSLKKLLTKVQPNLSLVQWLMDWANSCQNSNATSHIISLAQHCNIDVITLDNVEDYCTEKDIVQEEYIFGKQSVNSLSQIGWIYDEKVLQKAIYRRIVGYSGQFLQTLVQLEQWLLHTFLDGQVYRQVLPLIQPLKMPNFWYSCHTYPNFCEELLYPAISILIEKLDEKLYSSNIILENIKKIRIEYEELLVKVSSSLQSDSWQITIIAGRLPDAQTIETLPDWQKKWFLYLEKNSRLLPLHLLDKIEPYYPCIRENFRRYIFTKNRANSGNMLYVRKLEPEIYRKLFFWKDKVDKNTSIHIENFCQSLQEEWPKNYAMIIKKLEKCLQELSSHISSKELQKIQEVLGDDDFPALLPNPNIVGKKCPSKEVPMSLEKAQIQYVFSQKEEYLTITEISQYAFSWEDVKITISNGDCDSALLLVWSWVQEANKILTQFPILSENTAIEKLQINSSPPCNLSEITNLWPTFLPNIQPISSQEFYENFILSNHREEIKKLESLIKILKWSDKIAQIFFPSTTSLQNIADKIATFLVQCGILIEPTDLSHISCTARIIDIMWKKKEYLAIGERRILHYHPHSVVLQGYIPSFSYHRDYFIPDLREIFLQYWGNLQKINNRTLREQTTAQWEMIYYRIHTQPTLQYIIDFLNLGYEYWEKIQTSIPPFHFQALWLPVQQYLATHYMKIIEIRTFEIYTPTLHALYFEKEESLLQHPEPIGTILHIKQPAIIYTKENRIWQRGKVLVVANTA